MVLLLKDLCLNHRLFGLYLPVLKDLIHVNGLLQVQFKLGSFSSGSQSSRLSHLEDVSFFPLLLSVVQDRSFDSRR